MGILRLGMLRFLTATLLLFGAAVAGWSGGFELIKSGQEAEQAGHQNEAMTAYTAAIQADDLTDAQRAFAYSRRAGIKGFLGESIGGIDDYSNAIRLNPKLGTAYSLRGYLRGVVGQYDLAEKDHLAAIDLAKVQTWDEYLPWALQHYADLWRRRGNFKQALAYCDKAAEAKPYSLAQFRRAWIYLDMGKPELAKAEFQKFAEDMDRRNQSYSIFWPDERGAISRMRELK